MSELLKPEYLNYIILFLIAVYVMQGAYKGFLNSLANTVNIGFSWLIAAGAGPLLAKQISQTNTYSFLTYLTEVTDKVENVILARTPVDSLSPGEIDSIVDYANLPAPYGSILSENMHDLVFAGTENITVADYLNLTVANVTVSIIAFLIIYLLARVIISLVIATVDFANPFYVLRKYDSLIGGAVGAARAFMAMFVFCMLIPLILCLVSIDELTVFVNGSSFASFFYENNFLFNFISGVL